MLGQGCLMCQLSIKIVCLYDLLGLIGLSRQLGPAKQSKRSKNKPARCFINLFSLFQVSFLYITSIVLLEWSFFLLLLPKGKDSFPFGLFNGPAQHTGVSLSFCGFI